MAESRVRYDNPDMDYTSHPTHLRIINEGFDDTPWQLDGVDDVGNYTEMVWVYPTWQEAMDDVQTFISFCKEYVMRENRPVPVMEEDIRYRPEV